MDTDPAPTGPGGLVAAGHLGGYIAGGDPDSWCPDLWRWLVLEHGVRSVLDVGCGEGHAVDFFRELNVEAWGIDGVEQPNEHVVAHDFTKGYAPGGRPVDLVWSCEFVEHVEARFAPNFVEAFARGRLILMTHAVPGQTGWHHVNCRDGDYWIDVLEAAGYRHDPALTSYARALCAPSAWFARTGLAFRKA